MERVEIDGWAGYLLRVLRAVKVSAIVLGVPPIAYLLLSGIGQHRNQGEWPRWIAALIYGPLILLATSMVGVLVGSVYAALRTPPTDPIRERVWAVSAVLSVCVLVAFAYAAWEIVRTA